jgi:hypothetical protein
MLSVMATQQISIPVDPPTADAYQAARAREQRQLQVLLRLRLRELTSRPTRSLDDVLDEVDRAAEARGLTADMLDSMLGDS